MISGHDELVYKSIANADPNIQWIQTFCSSEPHTLLIHMGPYDWLARLMRVRHFLGVHQPPLDASVSRARETRVREECDLSPVLRLGGRGAEGSDGGSTEGMFSLFLGGRRWSRLLSSNLGTIDCTPVTFQSRSSAHEGLHGILQSSKHEILVIHLTGAWQGIRG